MVLELKRVRKSTDTIEDYFVTAKLVKQNI